MQRTLDAISDLDSYSSVPKNTLPMILLVEDSFEGQILIKHYIKGEYNVVTTTTGEQAVELARTLDVKAIIMDLHLAGQMTGIEATKIIRTMEGKENIPIIALTAYSMSDMRDRCLEAGCSDFLQKPANRKILLDLLRNLIEAQS